MRLASILAHVLASTALVACGGAISSVPDDTEGTSPTNGTTGSGTEPPRGGGPRPVPPPVDAGSVDSGQTEDAGCSAPPVLVASRGCSEVFQHVCGIPKNIDPDNLKPEDCKKLCAGPTAVPRSYWSCSAYLNDDLPGPAIECFACVEGRRPEGYVEGRLVPTVAGWLAHAADLERVSIDAFQILRRALAHYGAPVALLRRAELAEADEVRHAHVLATLARREGATVAGAHVEHKSVRALVDIALENAVEGCIRETFGALVAGFQAEHAERREIRRVMKQIYRDETAHAALAWDVHAWIMDKLDEPDRARVERAMVEAAQELMSSAKRPIAEVLAREVGLPRPSRATRLLQGLETHLWFRSDVRAA